MNSNQDSFISPSDEGKDANKFPENLLVEAGKSVRFSWKNLIILAITIITIVVVTRSVNFMELKIILLKAKPIWVICGFLCALGISLGQALVLWALTPKVLKFTEVILVQIVGSLAAVITPSGVGVALVNMRYLTLKKIRGALALATVTLAQLLQLGVIGLALMTVLLMSGRKLNFLFNPKIFLPVTVLVILLGLTLFFIPKLQKKLNSSLAKLKMIVRPQLHNLRDNPHKMAAAIIGSILQLVAMLACFYSCCLALQVHISLKSISTAFLISNSLASYFPTPGGIGPVEAALSGGLQVLGLNAAVSLAVAILYRLLTVWIRAACGWVALIYLKHRDLL